MNLNRTVIAEFEAFRGDKNEYVIKEFVAVDITTGRFVIVLFAPPYERARLHLKFQKINDWLETHYHRIRWNDGNVLYKNMVRIVANIFSDYPVVYTKGFETVSYTHLDVYKRQSENMGLYFGQTSPVKRELSLIHI